MSLPVVTVASGGLAVVDMTASKLGLPVIEASNGRGIAVTKVVGKPGLAVVYEAAGGGGASTMMSPTDKSAGIVLSGGNLTVGANVSTDQGVRSTTSKSSGKVYFEFTVTNMTGSDTSVGIMTGSVGLTTVGTNSTGAVLIYADGSIWFNGAAAGINAGAITNGTIVCIAVDVTGSRFWAKRSTGNWNGNVANDPATNVGGINISALFPTNAVFAGVTTQNTAASITINFGATAFNQTPPIGFPAWG